MSFEPDWYVAEYWRQAPISVVNFINAVRAYWGLKPLSGASDSDAALKKRAYTGRAYREMRAAGICVGCRGVARPARSLCATCATAHAERIRR